MAGDRDPGLVLDLGLQLLGHVEREVAAFAQRKQVAALVRDRVGLVAADDGEAEALGMGDRIDRMDCALAVDQEARMEHARRRRASPGWEGR